MSYEPIDAVSLTRHQLSWHPSTPRCCDTLGAKSKSSHNQHHFDSRVQRTVETVLKQLASKGIKSLQMLKTSGCILIQLRETVIILSSFWMLLTSARLGKPTSKKCLTAKNQACRPVGQGQSFYICKKSVWPQETLSWSLCTVIVRENQPGYCVQIGKRLLIDMATKQSNSPN